jgi:hypothetical protein
LTLQEWKSGNLGNLEECDFEMLEREIEVIWKPYLVPLDEL